MSFQYYMSVGSITLRLGYAPQPSPLLNLFHSTNLQHAAAPYSQDEPGALYQTHGPIYGADSRPRLTSNSTPSTGMAHAQTHAQRTGRHIGALDHYSTATPPFRRASEHLPRSPAFYAHRPGQGSVPPLQPMQTLGSLNYIDSAMTPIKIEISGTVDKGPFLSCDQEWTCYRRNYLACVCSYALSPLYYPNVPIQFTPTSSTASAAQTYQVYGFAMCISAVVAENEQQHIELVQHTPKRDKGPISKPSKIPMAPKTSSSSHHGMNPYGDGPAIPGTRGLYSDGLGGPQTAAQQLPAEHTFERIQFKNATLNNGKRRAAQQYYHLIVELWADVGAHSPDQYVKVAYRKSAKMIVRGRSPGHYQNERRGSQGNGPGGSAGNLSGYTAMGHMAADFNNSNAMLSGAGTGGYATTYDSRSGVYGGARHHEIPEEAIMAPDDGKALETSKAYHYYSGPMYDGHHDRVDLFAQRTGPESVVPSMAADSKVKHEYDFGMLPRPFNPSTPAPRVGDHRQHDHFDGKTTSGGYYPSIMSSSTGIHMTMA
ncbi:NDT80 / PhoG like DNA-binding family protein [Hirsutella rhossiliensis]|uniref:NDT80 / phoG like DNA-binding family domain-containing protein n=1 Tax=Hirsutella rhossiliensis TaxID=111463 RepID=A0A9P8N099_9HYPO|nr:NDT80 / phoG like DNA-binding family domain-containing protein [Hirsutella rhossiliensis]KAH0965783.1 NDT80 / phoG like DNA-binding family domain-containing protein [Hirsutella rhossiliensis]